MAKMPGHDITFLAKTGLLGMQGPAGGPPQVTMAQVADVERAARGWRQTAGFPSPPLVPELGALVLQMGVSGYFDGDLAIEVFAAGRSAPALSTHLSAVGPLTSIVLDIGALAGQRIERVTVSGTGDKLARAITVAGLVGTLP